MNCHLNFQSWLHHHSKYARCSSNHILAAADGIKLIFFALSISNENKDIPPVVSVVIMVQSCRVKVHLNIRCLPRIHFQSLCCFSFCVWLLLCAAVYWWWRHENKGTINLWGSALFSHIPIGHFPARLLVGRSVKRHLKLNEPINHSQGLPFFVVVPTLTAGAFYIEV